MWTGGHVSWLVRSESCSPEAINPLFREPVLSTGIASKNVFLKADQHLSNNSNWHSLKTFRVYFSIVCMTRGYVSGVCALYRQNRLLKEVTIALVGKYTRLQDSYASVVKALNHAAMACNHKLNLKVTYERHSNELPRQVPIILQICGHWN